MAKKTATKARPVLGKIAEVCNSNESSVINRVMLRKGKAVATDGYILAVRDIPEEAGLADTEALIPQSVAKKLAKESRFEVSHGSGSVGVRTADVIHSTPSNGYTPANFPAYDLIIPDPDNATVTIALNAAYLKRLADAITSDGIVTLAINGPLGAVHVKGNEGMGVIMPVLLD